MKSNNVAKLSVLASIIALFSGCATVGSKDFSCPAPEGFVCKTPTEIYALTNGDESSVYQAKPSKSRSNAEDGMFKSSKSSSNGSFDGNLNALGSANMGGQFSKPAYTPNSSPMPILQQPKVLRVWIAPWVDESETLNYPSYKFKEVTPRKWNFGGAQVFRNVLPTTAPENSADFMDASTETQQPTSNASQSNSVGQQLPSGIQKQNDMVSQNGLSTADFHNDQNPSGLPMDNQNQ
jgi:conjugal transfer pilus assembly protein TraV